MIDKSCLTIASIGQEGLWSIENIDTPGSAYNTLFSTRLSGIFSIQKLKVFFSDFINRHSVLRSTFKVHHGKLHVSLLEKDSLYFKVHNVSSFSENKIYNLSKMLHEKDFNLGKGPLFRVNILTKNEFDAILLVSAHHSVSDGFSLQILVNEFYLAFNNDLRDVYLRPKNDYKDFCTWQHNFVNSDAGNKQKRYWLNRLGHNLNSTYIPLKDKEIDKYKGNIYQFKINKDTCIKIKDILKNSNISLFAFFVSVYQILIVKKFNSSDVIIGHPSSGRLRSIGERKRSQYNDNIGYFVNPLLFKNNIQENTSFSSLLKTTYKLLKEDFKNQDFPFSRLYSALNLRQNKIELPQFVINFQKRRSDHRDLAAYKFKLDHSNPINTQDFNLTPYYIPQQLGSNDLEWEILESQSELYCNLKYRMRYFDEKSIKSISKYIIQIINQVTKDINTSINNFTINPGLGEDLPTNQFSRINLDYSKINKKIFQEVIKFRSSKKAIQHNEEQITYKQLEIISSAICNIIQNNSNKNPIKSALIFKKSPEMIASMIAIIKLGGTFIPIDAELPHNRILYMLDDSKPDIVLTNLEEFKTINNSIYIDPKQYLNYSSRKPFKNKDIKLNSPAYIIYTSGSTGKPKSAMASRMRVRTGTGVSTRSLKRSRNMPRL